MDGYPKLAHVAIRVKDIDAYLDFFQYTMDINIDDQKLYDDGSVKEVWLGGIQLQHDPDYNPDTEFPGQVSHIAIAVSDLEFMIQQVYQNDMAKQYGDKRNWFILPEGPIIELLERPPF